MKNIVIANDKLTVEISHLGAEIKSVKGENGEYMWDGNPNVWSGQAPILFPICGGLKDDKYIYDGKEYKLPKHGFARRSQFESVFAEKNKAVFSLKSNAETTKVYPFDFELLVTYELLENTLDVIYEVKNNGDGEMYFSVGSHEAYACPEGIEEYSVIFEKDEEFISNILNGNLLEYDTIKIAENGVELPLKYEYFAVDAQVFLNLKSRKATLKNNVTGKEITVAFDGSDYFLLWTKPDGKYMCLEAWCGIQDFVDSDYDIAHKRGIIRLDMGKNCVKKHSVTFN